MNLGFLTILFVLIILCCNEAYKILLVFNLPTRSLSHLGRGFVKHLHNAGHEITYVTAHPLKNIPAHNYREIDISKSVLHLLGDDVLNVASVLDKHDTADKFDQRGAAELAMEIADVTFQDTNFLTLLQDPTQEFDVVIVDLFENNVYAGLSVLYNCPMIWSFAMGAQWSVMKVIDETTNPAYTVDYMSTNVPPLTFVQRVEELWSQLKGHYIKEFIIRPKEKELYKRVFEPLLALRGKTLPSYSNIVYNASLIFANKPNVIENSPSIPQNFIFVGGQHVDNTVEPLNQKLQTIMDSAEHGVIYFSLGTFFKSKDFPRSVKKTLIKMFAELKQTVIWKYEGQDLKNLPKNLVILNWAPQPSILSHPNCLIFITNSGPLSSIEAIHFGVPVIGVPISFDQSRNAKRSAANGYSITVEMSYNIAEELKHAILKMLTDERYAFKAKELSQIYRDQRMPLDKEVVYWVEHVVRTRGAVHLRSPALQLFWFQKMYLDFIALLIVMLLAFKFTIRRVLVLAYRKKKTNPKRKRR